MAAPKAHLLIRKGRVLDPNTGRDEVLDILIENGRLVRMGASLDAPGAELFNAEGLLVVPGLVDTCVRLSDNNVASETRAAASGGVTHMCALPDGNPIIDSTAVVRLLRERAMRAGFARVLPLAAMTQQLDGKQLAEMQTLKEAGCIGVSNAGRPIQDTLTFKRCLEYAATFDIPVMLRPQDAALSAGGCAHDGPVATRLGLPGIPAVAETLDLARALLLVEATGVRAHVHQLSSAASVQLVRDAKTKGLPVTADVSVHHLLLDESAISGFNSHCHIQPPLRSSTDREALLAGVVDGAIDAVCSQHTPVGSSGKQVPFPASKPGVSGVETLLPLLLHLVEENRLTLPRAIDVLTRGAANCLHQTIGHLETGRSASLCVIDTRSRRRPSEDWISSTRNSPWLDAVLPGVVRLTVCEGKVSWLSD